MDFENFNIELMDNVEQQLKEPLKQVLDCMKKAKTVYSDEIITKFLNELKVKRIRIKTEKVITSKDNVANDIDRSVHSYGYVDFGIDSIIYNGRCDKKIIIWREVLGIDSKRLVKALAFLIEEYLSKDEERVFENYKMLESAMKKNKNFEYTMLTDFSSESLPYIGGFRRSILEKWCGYIDYASSDLISSYITRI